MAGSQVADRRNQAQRVARQPAAGCSVRPMPSPCLPTFAGRCPAFSSLQKSSKVLADAMEALLGAFLVAGGHTAALAFLQASRRLPSLWGVQVGGR